MTFLRFIFEVGNTRVQEVDDTTEEIYDSIVADWGTIEGYFHIWKKYHFKSKTIEELEELLEED